MVISGRFSSLFFMSLFLTSPLVRASGGGCDLQISPRVQAAVNILQEAVALQALSHEEFTSLAESKDLYNPFLRQPRRLDNYAFRKGFELRLASLKNDDGSILQKVLRKLVKERGVQNAAVEFSRKSTSLAFALTVVSEALFAGWVVGSSEVRMSEFEERPIFMGTLRNSSTPFGTAYVFDPFGPARVKYLKVPSDGTHQKLELFKFNNKSMIGILEGGQLYDLSSDSEIHSHQIGFDSEAIKTRAVVAVNLKPGEDLIVFTADGVYRKSLADKDSKPVRIHESSGWCVQKHVVGEDVYISWVGSGNEIQIYDVVRSRMLPPIQGSFIAMSDIAIGLMYRENGRTYVALNGVGATIPAAIKRSSWSVRILDLESRESRWFTPIQSAPQSLKFVFIAGEPYVYYTVDDNLHFLNLVNQKSWKIKNGGELRAAPATFRVSGRDYLLWGTTKGKLFLYDIELNEVVTKTEVGSSVFHLLAVEFGEHIYAFVGALDHPPQMLRVAVPDGGRQ